MRGFALHKKNTTAMSAVVQNTHCTLVVFGCIMGDRSVRKQGVELPRAIYGLPNVLNVVPLIRSIENPNLVGSVRTSIVGNEFRVGAT